MGAIFLSYAREDRAFAERLAHCLEQNGHSVWWDRHIDGGEEFAAEIEEALDQSEAVVVAWSQLSVTSRWVRDEASVGGDTGRLVPVTIDGTRPPLGFRQFHTLDLSGWKGGKNDRRTAELLQSVQRRIEAGTGTRAIKAAPEPALKRWHWINRRSAAAAIIAAILLVAAAAYFLRPGTEPPATLTVAILPFTADASDADARKLAGAARDAVAHTLSQGNFAVSAIDALPAEGGSPAEFVISGQVTSTPDKMVANIRMEETDHHVVVFSHQFEESRDKAWELPERVGAQVASQLSWTAPIIAIDRRHPSDPAITALILQSSTAGMNGTAALSDFERSRKLAAKAPKSPLAQDNLAFSTIFALSEIPRAERMAAVAAARQASDRTVKLAPEYSGGYISWCLLRSEVRILDCERHLLAGMKADPDAAFGNFFLGQLYHGIGRNAEAAELAKLSLAHDPYMPFKIAFAIRMSEATGRTEAADQLYRQSLRWWPDNEVISYYRLSGMIRRGDFKAALDFDRSINPGSAPDPVLSAVSRNSRVELQKLCANEKALEESGIVCMLGLARLGDLDAAYEIADQLYPVRQGRNQAEEDRIWLDNPEISSTAYLVSPAAAPLRSDPRFLPIAARVGLLAYWRTGRLPDFCTKSSEPVCASIRNRADHSQ